MFGYVLLFVTSRENQFQFTITETGEKKSVVFQSVSGHTISFDEISDCVQHVKVTQFAKKDTKRLIVERPDVDFLLEMNFENVVSGWTEEFDKVLIKYQRTTDGLSQ